MAEAETAIDQNRIIGSLWIVIGGLVLVVGIGGALLYAVSNLLVSIVGVFIGYFGMRTLNRGRRHFVPIGLGSIADDPRPPVLYLRPFHYDGVDYQTDPGTLQRSLIERGFWRQMGVAARLIRTNEQLFSRAFRRIGPLVAVGDPREKLPRLGAVRVHARQGTEWQQVVTELVTRASYVVLEVGLSESVLWEVRVVTGSVRPEQLVLSVPNDQKGARRIMRAGKRERRRQENYAQFRQLAADAFPVPLPQEIGRSKIIYFESDWTPKPTYYQREIMVPFGRRIRHRDDPKLEAIIWLNSVLF